MSNFIIGILVVLHVYCIEIIICFVVFKLVKKISDKMKLDSKTTYIASVQALHVMALIGVIYFVPLIALVISLALNSILVGSIILLMFGTTIFVTKKIIIPASDRKRMQLNEKYDEDLIEK